MTDTQNPAERIAQLEAALRDLVEAADSMRATYGFVQGETPEHDDTCLHDQWAEAFLLERSDAARAALAGQPADDFDDSKPHPAPVNQFYAPASAPGIGESDEV